MISESFNCAYCPSLSSLKNIGYCVFVRSNLTLNHWSLIKIESIHILIDWCLTSFPTLDLFHLFNSLPSDKFLDWSRLKAFADDKKKILFKNWNSGMGRKHNGKRRKCWSPAFFPFPTMFSEGFIPRMHQKLLLCDNELMAASATIHVFIEFLSPVLHINVLSKKSGMYI